MCDFCEKGVPLVTGKTNDYGIALQYPNKLIAYGYDVHGGGSNGLIAKINFCPICGSKLKEKVKKPDCFGELSKAPYPCWVKQVNECMNCQYNEDCMENPKKGSDNSNAIIALIMTYANSLNEPFKRWCVKSTGREYHGQVYFQEGVGFTNVYGELLEFR